MSTYPDRKTEQRTLVPGRLRAACQTGFLPRSTGAHMVRRLLLVIPNATGLAKGYIAMRSTSLPDTFTLRIPLTVEIVLELMDSRHSGQSGIHGVMTRAALDTAVKDTFGDQYSFDMIHLWFVIRSVQVERDSNSSYRQCIVLSCEKREEMIPVS